VCNKSEKFTLRTDKEISDKILNELEDNGSNSKEEILNESKGNKKRMLNKPKGSSEKILNVFENNENL
jgi:vacuolar-type H+-ATPase subunit H